jgi:hypothetical protein
MRFPNTKLTLKPLEWFEENAYKDKSNDFWVDASRHSANGRVNVDAPWNCLYVTQKEIDKGFLMTNGDTPAEFEWAVLETRETHPQYYV